MKEQWKQDLKTGVCRVGNCDITRKPCKHLNAYLNAYGKYIGPGHETHNVETVSRENIERLAEPPKEVRPNVWKFFKLLRSYGLYNDQIGILIRKFCFNMSRAKIIKEMGWVSNQTYDRRLKRALEVLKDRGFGEESNR